MGAFKIDVMLHDEEVIEFIKTATEPYVRDGNVSDWEFGMRDLTRYIAERLIDTIPELEQYRTAPPTTCCAPVGTNNGNDETPCLLPAGHELPHEANGAVSF